MRKLITFSLCFIGAAALLCSCGNSSRKAQEQQAAEQAAADSVAAAQLEKQVMEKIATLPANFAKLALEKYYDGTLFHRVINGFMIQGGDPLSKDPANKAKFGTGGPDYTVPAEFVPEHTHKKGALAAARRGDAANPLKESSGSQFYIVQDAAACAALDGDYTVFGETVEGFDVIDAIAAVQTDARDCPLQDVKIITVKLDEEL